MFIVGPYEFTREDAKNTLLAATKILAHMSEGRDGSLEHLQTSISQLLQGLIIEKLSDGEIATTLPMVWTAISEATPTLRAHGHIPPAQTGTVLQLNASNGGVPKQAIDAAYVGWKGVEGDRQATRKHHGRPFQALSLWSAEVIETLRVEGHQIFPGSAGENITVSGIPSGAFRPGAHFRIGTMRGFLTSYAIPCKQNNDWFVNKDFKRMSHERGDECRLYAMVTTCGTISISDTFELFADR